jgi:putative flippase GtrA
MPIMGMQVQIMSMVSSEPSEVAAKREGTWLAYPFYLWNQIILKLSARFGGAKPKELERFLKFATVGVVGAFIDFGMLNLLQTTVLRPTGPQVTLKVGLATGAAFVSAVSSNFVWNRYWTYPDSRSRSVRQQWVQFAIVSLVGLIFRLIWVRMLFGPFGDLGVNALQALGVIEAYAKTATTQLGTNIAQFFAIWIVMIWNFFANRYWTYNDVE